MIDEAQNNRSLKYEATHTIVTPNVDFIVITEEKLWINAEKYLKDNNKEWLIMLSLFASIGVVIFTAEFKDMLLPGATWQAIFIIVALISLVLAIRGFITWFRCRQTIDDFVSRCATKNAK